MTAHGLAACVAALFLSASIFGHTVALRLLLLSLGIVLAAIAIARNRDDIRALPQIWLPFALWAAWAALSLTWSLEPARTLKEFRNEVGYTAFALWICFVGAQARNAARIFVPVIAAAATTACIIALRDYSLALHDSIGFERYSLGWHGGPGDHSSALLTLMPCVAMAGWYAGRAGWPRWATLPIWALAALFFASAYTTLNRTVWFGFAVQFVLLGILVLLRRPASERTPMDTRTKVAATALAVAVLAGGAGVLLKIQAEREAFAAGWALERDPRIALWPEVVERVWDRPLLGWGFGRGILRESLQEKFEDLNEHLWHAHNLFLDAMLQIGVPGLILFLLLLGAILREGWRLARAADEAAAACGIALIGVVAGMIVRNMTDTLLLRQNSLLYWGVVGVLLAWGSLRSWRASS